MHVCGGCVACAVIIVVVCAEIARCGPSVRRADSASSDSEATDGGAPQTAANKWETQETYYVLTDVLEACGGWTPTTHPYCSELVVNDDNGYTPLGSVIMQKTQNIQTILTALSAAERKAIVCRGLRRLLPIVMYGIFADDVIRGRKLVGAAVFDELFATEPEPESEGSAEYGRDGRNGRIRAGYVEKVKLLVRAVRPFAAGRLLDDGADEAFGETRPADPSPASYRRLMLSTFRSVDDSYRTQCFPGYVDTDVLLTANVVKRARTQAHAIWLIGQKADRAFERARGDFEVLLFKWYKTADKRETAVSLQLAYFRTFNRYADPAVWSLIGDEIFVALSDGDEIFMASSDGDESTTTTTLDVIASRDKRRIDEMADALVESVRTAVKCRGLMYVNLMTKLYANTTRALLWQPRPKPKAAGSQFRKYYGRIEVDGLMHGFGAHLLDQIPAEDEGRDKLFEIYSEYNVRLIGSTVDDIGESFNVMGNVTVDAELTAMVVELEDALRRPPVKRRTVEALIKWRERGERMYRDWCLHADDEDGRSKRRLTTLDDTVREVLQPDNGTAPVTLNWITNTLERVIELVNEDLENGYVFYM